MKQYTLAFVASIAYTSIVYGMQNDDHNQNQLFKDNSSPVLSRVEIKKDIDFGIIINATESVVEVCYNELIKPATSVIITTFKLTAPLALSYIAACFIDPKPYKR